MYIDNFHRQKIIFDSGLNLMMYFFQCSKGYQMLYYSCASYGYRFVLKAKFERNFIDNAISDILFYSYFDFYILVKGSCAGKSCYNDGFCDGSSLSSQCLCRSGFSDYNCSTGLLLSSNISHIICSVQAQF